MNRTIAEEDRKALAATLHTLYAPIAEPMRLVEQRLKSEMTNPHPVVDELVRYGCLLGGKRLRPALVMLSGAAVGPVGDDHVTLGTVVEMIHTATLVHDDVLDQASIRRRIATVNARWDNEASILLGDFLFSHAFYLAATLDSTWACRRIGRSTNVVVEGELRQKGSRGDFRLSEDDYLSILNGKTAELCACSCRLGAEASGASSDLAERLEEFGRDLGLAFQIADDLLDLEGTEATVGKSLGTDFEQRLPTLPLIHALRSMDDVRREEWIERLNDSDLPASALQPLFAEFGSIAYARRRADDFAASARRQLETLPSSAARESLRRMTAFAVSRSA